MDTCGCDPTGEEAPPAQAADAEEVDVRILAQAKRSYGMVLRRRQLLGDRMFFDPAWNMLLDLFICEADGRRLSVSALCIGSHSSAATALRYATMLIDAGLVCRTADETDGRRSYVNLTEKGRQSMKDLLSH